jgi:hypothetical protein
MGRPALWWWCCRAMCTGAKILADYRPVCPVCKVAMTDGGTMMERPKGCGHAQPGVV